MRTAAAIWLLLLLMACSGAVPSTPATPVDIAAPNRTARAGSETMIVRISEIDIDPNQLEQYRHILKGEAEASVRLEPGVISIFPMYMQDDPAAVRILEIYASREAYEAHLKSPHFQHYKSATREMVRALRLVDMKVIDHGTMAQIFAKM